MRFGKDVGIIWFGLKILVLNIYQTKSNGKYSIYIYVNDLVWFGFQFYIYYKRFDSHFFKSENRIDLNQHFSKKEKISNLI